MVRPVTRTTPAARSRPSPSTRPHARAWWCGRGSRSASSLTREDPFFTVNVYDVEGFPTNIAEWDGATTPGFVFDEVADLVYDYAVVFSPTPPEVAALFTAPRDIFTTTVTSIDAGTYLVRTYELSLEFTYGASALATPVTRLYPRDDALGLGSAPRLYPPPRRGRIVGGYL